MNSKVLIASGLVLAFVVGMMASGLYTTTSKAFNPAQEQTAMSTNAVKLAPVSRSRYVEPRATVSSATATAVNRPEKQRSLQREVLIVGGSAGAGAAIGAVSGGKKGAAIGAVSGGVAGLLYDMITRNNK